MKRFVLFSIVLLIIFSCCNAFAQDQLPKEIVLSGLSEKIKGGVIDWEKQMMYASGQGAVPVKEKVPNRGVAFLKARDYAKMDAIANLLMLIEGTAISYDGYGRDYMADVTIRQKIEGYVKNVEILKTERLTVEGDTIVTVTVGTRIFGSHTPGAVFIEKIASDSAASVGEKSKAVPLIEIPLDIPKFQTNGKELSTTLIRVPNLSYKALSLEKVASSRPVEPGEETAQIEQEGPFTSVIIDTRGYDVTRSISPKIRKDDGSEVWGTVSVDPDYAIQEGIVAYAKDMESAKKCSRCGSNPLIINVIGRAGGKAMCDPMISNADAQLVLDENQKTKFLEKFSVIFISDPSNAKF